jgi:hypothetical protein
MSEQDFQTQVLAALSSLNGRFDTLEGKFDTLEGKFDTLEGKFDTLEGKVDILTTEFQTFRDNQEQFNNAIWSLNTQAFNAINDIHQETVAPWKRRQTRSV